MWYTFIIVAVRRFRRNQVITAINILGLSLGLATCLVAGLYIKHHLSADRFHENLNAIQRVTVEMQSYSVMGTPYLFSETVLDEVPSVEGMLRTTEVDNTVVQINDETGTHQLLFADPSFLSFFTFPLAEGSRAKALTGLRQVVISHEMKERYFPETSALGKHISITINDEMVEFEISGVAKALPAYSSMYFDMVVPLENYFSKGDDEKNSWDRFRFTTFLKIQPENLKSFEEAMRAFAAKHMAGDRQSSHIPTPKISAYRDHHLDGGFGGGGLRDGKDASALLAFGGIAIVILLLACFNFMNLTNAQSSTRAVEVGVKKVIGARKEQLVKQFLAEAMVMTFLASLLALGLAEISLLTFRDLLQESLSLFDRSNADVFAALVIVTLLTGLLAGLYPSLVLSNIQTIKTFKRTFSVTGSNLISRMILSLQFCVSIVLIVCAIAMWKQQAFIANKDLGYNQEQVIAISIPERDKKSIDLLKNKIKALPQTIDITRTNTNFDGQGSIMHHMGADNKPTFLYFITADDDFFRTMQMEFVKGHGFGNGQPAPENAIVVNESFVKELGMQDSIGVRLGSTIGSKSNPIITGVVKDFHFTALRNRIRPLFFLYDEQPGNAHLLVRLAPNNVREGINEIQAVWNEHAPDSPFQFSFLEDNIQRQYEEELRWSSVITLATGMAMFLSVLGLVGLAMFTAAQRRKEISIRKVLGASLIQLISVLSRQYILLVVIAFAIAAPVAWYLISNYWLNNFAYKVTLDWLVYAVALLVVLAIACVSIGTQTLRAALTNPAETLKEE